MATIVYGGPKAPSQPNPCDANYEAAITCTFQKLDADLRFAENVLYFGILPALVLVVAFAVWLVVRKARRVRAARPYTRTLHQRS